MGEVGLAQNYTKLYNTLCFSQFQLYIALCQSR